MFSVSASKEELDKCTHIIGFLLGFGVYTGRG